MDQWLACCTHAIASEYVVLLVFNVKSLRLVQLNITSRLSGGRSDYSILFMNIYCRVPSGDGQY